MHGHGQYTWSDGVVYQVSTYQLYVTELICSESAYVGKKQEIAQQ